MVTLALDTAWFGSRLSTIASQVRSGAELGFRHLAIGRTEVPVGIGALEEALSETGARIVAVRSGALEPASGGRASDRIASPVEAERRLALDALARHARLAARAGGSTLVVSGGFLAEGSLEARVGRVQERLSLGEPFSALGEELEGIRLQFAAGRDRALDLLCRSLHALGREAPGLCVALETPGDLHGLPDLEGLSILFGELRALPLAYLHDAARAHRLGRLGGPAPAAWLERFVDRLVGVRLHDVVGWRDGRPPGTGEVDFQVVGDYLSRRAFAVLALAPEVDRAGLVESVRFCRKLRVEAPAS